MVHTLFLSVDRLCANNLIHQSEVVLHYLPLIVGQHDMSFFVVYQSEVFDLGDTESNTKDIISIRLRILNQHTICWDYQQVAFLQIIFVIGDVYGCITLAHKYDAMLWRAGWATQNNPMNVRFKIHYQRYCVAEKIVPIAVKNTHLISDGVVNYMDTLSVILLHCKIVL